MTLSIRTFDSDLNTPKAQTDSKLLRLPAELRNEIYAFALGGNTWSINMNQGKPRANNATPRALALLQVNRQIHAEAQLFPYLCNTFEGRHSGHLRIWVQSLTPTQRKSITSIKHYQRSYITEGVRGLDVSPIFWMDTPNMVQWNLEGLKRIEIEVVLHKWGWNSNEEGTKKVRARALSKLRVLVEDEHPGTEVVIVSKCEY
ncbi:beta transducin [Ascochyta clinopodiicola]|nr:beta transducin [Ascochyta clinopodiicola]